MAISLVNRLLHVAPASPVWEEAEPQALYDVLWAYYHSNSLYDNVQRYLRDHVNHVERLKPLRNPANRATEFYVSKIWPSKFEFNEGPEAIRESLKRVWKWSNWNTKKYFVARQFAVTGDLFLRVATSDSLLPTVGENPSLNKVFFQSMDPGTVTDFEKDDRGFLTMLRVDIPKFTPDGRSTWYTEYWTPFSLRIWRNSKGPTEPIEKFPPTPEEYPLEETYGIDFIPIVHGMFRDVGNKRGQGCFTHCLDKIDEANRIATRLHFLMYRYNAPMWAVSAGGSDASGRPLPAPRLGADNSNTLAVDDDAIIRLPGNGQIHALVAGVDWSSHLNLLNAHLKELTEDLPELAYYEVRQMTQISGRAVQYLLSDAIDRAKLARESILDIFIKANEMALSIGKALGTFEVTGEYDSGDWDHTFKEEDIFPQSSMEEAETEAQTAGAKKTKLSLGVSREQVLTELGYDEKQVRTMIAAYEATLEAAQAAEDEDEDDDSLPETT